MKAGDRVKLSEVYFKEVLAFTTENRREKAKAKQGVVINILPEDLVRVLWDNAKLRDTYHKTFLEVLP